MTASAGRLRRIKTVYKVFGPYLKPYRWQGVLAYGALGASVLMTLLKPWPLKLVLDVVILRKQALADVMPWLPEALIGVDGYLLLTLLCVGLVAIVALESLFGYFQKILFASIGQSATTDVLEHVFMHLQTLPRAVSGGAQQGDVIVRLTSDIKTMRDLLVNHIQKLGSYGITFIGTAAVMAVMDWRLTVIGLGVVPLIFLASYHFSRRIREVTKQKRKTEGEVASIVQETLTSITVVQAYAQEEHERKRFQEQARASLDAGIESARLGGAFSRSVKLLNTGGTALVIWFGASRVLQGEMSPGDLVVLAAYIAELYVPIQNVSELAVQFMESLVSGERVLELVQTAPRIKDSPNAVRAPAFQGELTFEDVEFGYEPGKPVLKGLSFTVKPGETLALVGASGSGKSTIVNLIPRFYDPWKGRILIDGRDIRAFRLSSLRRQISLVLQEAVLFRRTVRENIAYGRPGAKLNDVIKAAQTAQAHEFIEELPGGYNAQLDEQGGNLSGGQRQRLTLARAFLMDAPILILDEPTSGQDNVTEAQLSETLETLTRGKTTLIIAHRLSTIERADRILVIVDGKIAEEGSHAELLAGGHYYRELFEAQVRPETA